jgi:transcriptional antiterminator
MLYIHEQSKITIAKLAEVLSCSQRTIHRNMGEELKREKELLNRQHEKI